MLIIRDNLGWYCDGINIFIRHRQIQIKVIKVEESLTFAVKIKL
jgi:hypothetical protein